MGDLYVKMPSWSLIAGLMTSTAKKHDAQMALIQNNWAQERFTMQTMRAMEGVVGTEYVT